MSVSATVAIALRDRPVHGRRPRPAAVVAAHAAGLDRRAAHRDQHGALRRAVGRGALGLRRHPRHRGLGADRHRDHGTRHRDRAARRSCSSSRSTRRTSPTGSPRRSACRPGSCSGRSRRCGSSGSSIDDWRTLSLARRARGIADRGVDPARDSARRSRCSCSRSGGGAPSRPRWRRAGSGRRASAPGLARRTSGAPNGWSSRSDASSPPHPRRPRSPPGAGMSSGRDTRADAASTAGADPRTGSRRRADGRRGARRTRGDPRHPGPARAPRRTERRGQVDARGCPSRRTGPARPRCSCASTTSTPAGTGLERAGDALARTLVRRRRRGDIGGWRRWDWARDRPGALERVHPGRALIIEGCGAFAAGRRRTRRGAHLDRRARCGAQAARARSRRRCLRSVLGPVGTPVASVRAPHRARAARRRPTARRARRTGRAGARRGRGSCARPIPRANVVP